MDVDVLVIGAGPAGLSAAIELRRLGAGQVLVVDREATPGGVPRHSLHTGYGLRDLRRVMPGPAYARMLTEAATSAGAQIRAACTVTDLSADGTTATLTSALGIETAQASAVLLATGCRERPRPARLVPGDRPPSIMTTGELQQRVNLGHERLPGRALVIGAEHVSFSAMTTLTHAGAEVIALVTEHDQHQSYAAFNLGAKLRWQTPVWTSTAVRRITGRGQLAGAELADVHTGATRFVPCEYMVFTADWIPDHALGRTAGLAIDPGTRGPAVDTSLATSAPGIFAAGNLIHAAETADIAALSGRHAARYIAHYLTGSGTAGQPRIPIHADPPLLWISPNAISPAPPPPLGRFILRSTIFRTLARLEVRQDTQLLALSRPHRLIPGRPLHLSSSWRTRINPTGGPIHVSVR